MKILIINYAHYIIGGPERYLFNVTKLLEEHGHQVIPFSMNLKNNISTKYKKYFASPINPDGSFFFNGKSSLKTKIKQISRLFYSKEVEKKLSLLIKKEKPDIAYILHYHKKLSPAALVACKKNNIPIVVRISDYLMMCPQAHFFRDGSICEKCKRNKFNSVKNKCVKGSLQASLIWYFADKFHHMIGLYDKIDKFIVTNEFMKKKLQEYSFPDRIKEIPTFAYGRQDFKKDFEYKRRKNQICYIGRLNKIKGTDLLLKSFRKLSKKNPKLKLVLMGKDEIDLVRDFKRQHPKINIEYIPHSSKEQVLKIFSESLYFVFPVRWYENLPNVILESFSVGTPVIAPNIGSIKTMVTDGRNGFLYKYNNLKYLNKTIFKAVSLNNNDYNKLQKNCLDLIKNKYSSGYHYNRLIKVFNKLL